MAVGVQNSNLNGRWYSKLMPLDLFSLACYLTTSSSRPVDWGLLSFEFPDRRRSQLPLRAAVVTRVPVGCFVAVVLGVFVRVVRFCEFCVHFRQSEN